jgi:hypothetical protein
MTVEDVADLLTNYKIPHSSEIEMQSAIAKILASEGVQFVREKVLSKKDVVDFLVEGGVAIECKVKGRPLSIHRQLERYAGYDDVNGIILFSAVHMGVKSEINGKPAYMVQCGVAWL